MFLLPPQTLSRQSVKIIPIGSWLVFLVTEVGSRIFPLLHTIGLMKHRSLLPQNLYKQTWSSVDKIVEIPVVF